MGILTLGLMGSITAQEKKDEEKREELDEIIIDSRFKIKKENSGENCAQDHSKDH